MSRRNGKAKVETLTWSDHAARTAAEAGLLLSHERLDALEKRIEALDMAVHDRKLRKEERRGEHAT